MKRCIALTLFILLLITLGACSHPYDLSTVKETQFVTETPSILPQTVYAQPQNTDKLPNESELSEDDSAMASITVTVGNSVFSAKLYNNDTSTAFLARLPMTLNMSELNGNEKYFNLPDNLPTDTQRVGSIKTGDLMLYGSDCLVLFYDSFNTPYSYTKLGYIEDTDGLANALGQSMAEVKFAADK